MFVILLKFTDKRDQSDPHLEGHKAWIARGFDDGVFLLVGSLASKVGGSILAHNTTLEELERRVNEDPFVAEGIVTTEIFTIAPVRTDAKLDFLMA